MWGATERTQQERDSFYWPVTALRLGSLVCSLALTPFELHKAISNNGSGLTFSLNSLFKKQNETRHSFLIPIQTLAGIWGR